MLCILDPLINYNNEQCNKCVQSGGKCYLDFNNNVEISKCFCPFNNNIFFEYLKKYVFMIINKVNVQIEK